jgi:DNA-directed RNA polymerase sigma subunit (sigma70/sigma32)
LTITAIAELTGLSTKVVSNTLRLVQGMAWVPDEEIGGIVSPSPTPEQEYIRKEMDSIFAKRLSVLLNPDEIELFLCKLNLDGDKSATYNELAVATGLSVNVLRKKYSQIVSVNGIIKVPTFIGENSPLYYAIW